MNITWELELAEHLWASGLDPSSVKNGRKRKNNRRKKNCPLGDFCNIYKGFVCTVIKNLANQEKDMHSNLKTGRSLEHFPKKDWSDQQTHKQIISLVIWEIGMKPPCLPSTAGQLTWTFKHFWGYGVAGNHTQQSGHERWDSHAGWCSQCPWMLNRLGDVQQASSLLGIHQMMRGCSQQFTASN